MEQECARYRANSGQLGGSIVASGWTTAKPKNVGRSNETTPEQQAAAEIGAAYTLKEKKGYTMDLDSIDAVQAARISPMLAKEYGDYADKLAAALGAGESVLVQPKLDGIRCIATSAGLWTRGGNPIVAVPHIQEALRSFFERDPRLILDGELYNHVLKDDFPALVSLIKKQKPTPEDLQRSLAIQYWIYDCLPGGRVDLPTVERIDWVAAHMPPAPSDSTCVAVPTWPVDSLESIDRLYENALTDGFEGAIIRRDGPYENKRSKLLLKRKEMMDTEFALVGIHEGEGNRSGMAGYAEFVTQDGQRFRANIVGDRGYLQALLRDKDRYAGGTATVEFFHYTPYGIPRFPRAKAFFGRGETRP
jgi:DNA ligase-1